MSVQAKRILGITFICVALVILIATGVLVQNMTSAGAQPKIPGQTRNFTLYVRTAQVAIPGGKKIFAFGFTDDPDGPAKIPGPQIIVNEGDTVNIKLVDDKDPTKTQFNPDGDGHTIHLHGLDMPSSMDGDPMTAPGGHSVLQGQSFTYHFVAKYPGTYWYHCHEGAAEHIQMGMYGPLIIRPNGHPNEAYPDTPTFDKEYTFVLSEMDSAMHDQDYNGLYKGQGDDPNWSQYHPNYFFINGKVWPDTMKDPRTNIEATVGQTVLVRLINTGYMVHSMHTHGFHFLVVGSDGRKLDSPYYKDTISVGPGERYDILIKLDQPGRYMFHDHTENTNTNNGEYPGGMITMINVNNPDGSNPVPISQMMQNS